VTAVDWPAAVHAVLTDLDVRQVAYVPDAGHARLIDACRADERMTAVSLSTEEEGVAVLAGAWLGGQRGVLLMQSSGVGNCINMLAMNRVCRFPLLMLVTMRGQWGETNPWQVPMGQATPEVLRLAGTLVFEVDAPDRVEAEVRAAAALAFTGDASVAVLISQRLIGAKQFAPTEPAARR
jgi:sulfopyruvate decarboxylase alpha subunit